MYLRARLGSEALVERKRRLRKKLASESGEFGISSLIGVAIGLIIAGFVLIPGVRDFAGLIVSDMNTWWNNVVSKNIFPN